MSSDWQEKARMSRTSAAVLLPPALVDETGWDILLVLHSDRSRKLGLDQLAAVVSASEDVMRKWLSALKKQKLITGDKDSVTGEPRAALTTSGRELLDRYLSATNDLQFSKPH